MRWAAATPTRWLGRRRRRPQSACVARGRVDADAVGGRAPSSFSSLSSSSSSLDASVVMAKKRKAGRANPGSGGKRKFFVGGGGGGSDGGSGAVKSAFESVSHRRKFDILGRKVKGARGNVLKARTEAVEKRRRTLLREHEASGKANAFVDRRFGEYDDGLSKEEKSIGRLAKARLRQLKKSKNFSLAEEGDDDDDDGLKTLTHLGQPLAERDMTAKPTHGEDDDDENLDKEMTRSLHFGGGDFEPTLKRGDDNAAPERRKSKKDVMDELIAKSKFHKAEKQKQREDDDNTLTQLDAEFKEISQGGLLAGALRKAVGHMKPTKKAAVKAPEEKDEYDTWARTLAYERRGQAGDRAKTQEELEAQEKLALEQAERKRLKRMRGATSDDESSDDDGPQGGYAARRRRAKKSDQDDEVEEALHGDSSKSRGGAEDLEENFTLESDEDEESGSDEEDSSEADSSEDDDEELDDAARLRKSLKSELKNVDKGLDQGKNRLRKLGILQDGVEPEDDDEEEDDDDEDDASGDEEEGDSSDEEDDDDEGDEEEDERAKVLREIEEEEEDDVPTSSKVREAQLSQKLVTSAKEKQKAAPTRTDIPFTFPMPESADDLDSMIGNHNAEDASTIITRIRACNAPTLAAENRKRTQTLFGLLLQRFEILAGQSPLPMDHLDVLSSHIVDLSTRVPFFTATAVKARVEKMSARLRQALRQGETGWPPSRTILLLSLFAAIFPTTDKSHPVMTPVSLYIGNLLAHCAIRSVKDACLAVILSTMASVYSTRAERIFPEALALMNALVHTASRSSKDWAVGLPTHLAEQIGGPWLSAGLGTKAEQTSLPQALDGIFGQTLEEKKLSSTALNGAVACLRQLSRAAVKTPSASELLSPIRGSIVNLRKALKKTNKELAELCDAFVKELDDGLAGAVKSPLAYHKKVAEAIKTYNPMYEEDGYQKGRDYDPNRERAEARKLKKQLKQESRGAMRELRKDNRFMADARSKEQAEAADERGARQKDLLSFLEKQEADFKSGGQGGQIVKNKRRVSKGSRRAF